jgi:PIN domain nuclease of toxin-antitoxin system
MADLLLDTHAALWWWTGLPGLTLAARTAIESAVSVNVSAISALEIAIKYRIGKLDMIGDPAANFPGLVEAHGFKRLDVTDRHALVAGLLPGNHRDPFDRVISAQALVEGLTIVSGDQAFFTFGCKVLW